MPIKKELKKLISEQQAELELNKRQDRIYPEIISSGPFFILTKRKIVIALHKSGVPIPIIAKILSTSKKTIKRYIISTSTK